MTYESILESLLYYSPRFREVMKKIDHPISKEILNHEGENILPDITFIDIDDDGLISFSTMNKLTDPRDIYEFRMHPKQFGCCEFDYTIPSGVTIAAGAGVPGFFYSGEANGSVYCLLIN